MLVKQDWTLRHGFLTIDLAPFVKDAAERLHRLAVAREAVVSSPDILGGIPVFKGTRVPVYDIAAAVAAGASVERILEAYPSLDAKKIELALVYAEAHPPRGRPRATCQIPAGAVIIADRRIPHNRKHKSRSAS